MSTIPVIVLQAVDAAVAAAVADARVKTKEEVEAASAAKKAAADQQLLRELEDKTEALTNQVNAATEQLRSTETALRCVTNLLCLKLSTAPAVYHLWHDDDGIASGEAYCDTYQMKHIARHPGRDVCHADHETHSMVVQQQCEAKRPTLTC